MKITERAVRAVDVPQSGSIYLWDGEIPGFGLRVWASGKRSFVFRYGGRGRRRLMTLGEWGTLTVHQARQKAQRMRGRVLDGGDPLRDREKAAREEEGTVRFSDMAALYLERWARPHRQSWREDERRIETYIIPAFGSRYLKDLKRAHVTVLHAEIGKLAPVEANRVRELVRAIWNKAQDWGLVAEGATNPAVFRKGDRFEECSRERYVTRAELPALWSAIGTEPNVYIRATMRLYLFVALRKTELLRARWSDVDLEAQEWSIPNTKSGKPHTVPLSAPAVAILEALPRTADNPYVFPGRKRGTHLVNIDKSWRRVRRTAGLDDVWVHDLRRTVGSWIATAGTSLAIVGQVLGHAPGDVKATAIYARLQRSAAREALESHASALMAVVSTEDHGQQPGS